LHLRRRAIARAVAGTLPVQRELRLRVHLRSCDACRAEYDRSSQIMETIAGAAGRPDDIAARRERGRLAAVLGAEAGDPAAERPRRRPWAVVALAAVPVAAAVVLLLARAAPSPRSDGGVTLRGAGDDGAGVAGAPAVLVVYASRKGGPGARGHGPVRIAAELPASGEGKVSMADYVQFGVRGLRAPSLVTVIGIDDGGQLHRYVPRPGAPPPRVEPGGHAAALGASVDFGRGHRAGRVRVYALLSAAPLGDEELAAAAARLDRRLPGAPPLDLPVAQVAGLLTIEPEPQP
jgi:hypothetical protein